MLVDTPIAPADPAGQPVDERTLSRLRWRCRRGMLENDLLIERFLARQGDSLTQGQAGTLGGLMDMTDNDLLDVLLSRRSLAQVEDGRFDSPEGTQLIELLQRKAS